MKKLILSALALMGLGAMGTDAAAQFYVVKDGKVIYALEQMPDYVDFPESKFSVSKDNKVIYSREQAPDYITFENPMPCGGAVGEVVDMGLSVKWSSWNVGASKPEEYGGYYAWGETETKENYGWNTYAYKTDGYSDYYGINKYQVKDGYFDAVWYKDAKYRNNGGKTVLDKADDAAAANWQGGWVMPTQADWQELANSCYMVWTTMYNSKSVNGWIVYKAKNDADKGKKVYSGNTPSSDYDVSSDAHIFLPAAGYRSGSRLNNGDSRGCYWSSSLHESYSVSSRYADFGSDYFYLSGNGRYVGQTVRPVCPAQGITNGHDAVDLGLPSGKLWATCNVGASAPEASGGYFAWGETAAKSDYSLSTYTIEKFSGDNKSVLEAADDVATQSWGEEWRMPTIAEWQELYNNTTREWTDDYNGTGVKGYILTSTKEGHTNASIFLPAAGYRNGSDLGNEGSYGYYWSSSLYEGYSYGGRYVYFYSGYFPAGSSRNRYVGQSVRPVCPAQ